MNEQKLIEFSYKDTHGKKTRRTAKPLHYTKSPHGLSALRAYCYLRNEERTFIIRKMSKMRIV